MEDFNAETQRYRGRKVFFWSVAGRQSFADIALLQQLSEKHFRPTATVYRLQPDLYRLVINILRMISLGKKVPALRQQAYVLNNKCRSQHLGIGFTQ